VDIHHTDHFKHTIALAEIKDRSSKQASAKVHKETPVDGTLLSIHTVPRLFSLKFSLEYALEGISKEYRTLKYHVELTPSKSDTHKAQSTHTKTADKRTERIVHQIADYRQCCSPWTGDHCGAFGRLVLVSAVLKPRPVSSVDRTGAQTMWK
jgi:hypothetical protein